MSLRLWRVHRQTAMSDVNLKDSVILVRTVRLQSRIPIAADALPTSEQSESLWKALHCGREYLSKERRNIPLTTRFIQLLRCYELPCLPYKE